LRALYAAVLGMARTAPAAVLRKYERWLFCQEHGWTFAEYDAAKASDIQLAHEFAKIQQAAIKQAAAKQKETPPHGR